MDKRIIIVALTCFMFLAACGEKPIVTEEKVTTESYKSVQYGDEIFATETDAIKPSAVFDTNQDIPIIADNKLVGYINITNITRLGVYDWYNPKVSESINHCYSIEADVDFSKFFDSGDEITLICSPKLVSKEGVVLGKLCKVGWSGFDNIQQFFKNDAKHHIEFELQPYEELSDNMYLVLELTDPQNRYNFEDIYLNPRSLASAKQGNGLLVEGDSYVVESVNGAKYEISFTDLWYERHKVYPIGDENYSNYSNSYFYDFNYKITYISGPSNERRVGTFDAYNGDRIIKLPKVKVFADNCEEPLEIQALGAKRIVSLSPYREDYYVTDSVSSIFEGECCEITENRLAVNQNLPTKYVRFVIEFPDEFNARTLDESVQFNGRFLVFQLPVEQREVD